MDEPKTKRAFQERFLDGYQRSELPREVQRVKPRFQGMRKKYATWALGASLALGGLGVPMKMIQDAQHSASADAAREKTGTAEPGVANDLQEAKSIADQVAGGVQAVAGGVAAAAGGLESAARSPLNTVEEAPKKLGALSDQVKERFFRTQVPFGSIIYNEARKNNLPPELVAAVVHTESKFKPTARSAAGAVGLMQLVPRTGRWMGARNLTNPAENIAAGTKYLKYLSERFDGDTQKTIAAYNAGEGNVRRFNGVPPFRETRNYVQRVRGFQRDLGDQMEGSTIDAQMQVADAR